MRIALSFLIVAAASLPAGSAHAAQTWCAVSNEGYANCGFATGEACRATVAGNGGYCMPPIPSADLHPPDAYTHVRRTPKKDEKLDAMLDKMNQKSKSLNICRGC